ncbi:1-acyl-sn-glycerol-3-phosphate acyltransferase beta [Trichonephila clavipes]|nr:1-acyl-sn-glycerol-3-phosphate acyltransferase beta [Trichonephila clavipes]
MRFFTGLYRTNVMAHSIEYSGLNHNTVSSGLFTCRNCGGGDRGRVAIYRPFGEVSLSLNRTVTCMVLKANDRRTSCPCHDEFRGPRSDYVRQVKLWIFPEGTRNDSGTLLPFKKGAFHIATQAKIPIVPIVFSEYTDFYSIGKKIFDRGTITVTVLPWIKTEHLTSVDVPSLTEEVRSIMMSSLKLSATEASEKKLNGSVIEKKSQ